MYKKPVISLLPLPIYFCGEHHIVVADLEELVDLIIMGSDLLFAYIQFFHIA